MGASVSVTWMAASLASGFLDRTSEREALAGLLAQVREGQSTVLVIALAFVVVNLLTDLLYRAIDPRVRAS